MSMAHHFEYCGFHLWISGTAIFVTNKMTLVIHLKFYISLLTFSLKRYTKGFPGGAVVKNPPANAGDTGLSPGPGSSHMLWSNQARVPQLLTCTLEPASHNYWSPCA